MKERQTERRSQAFVTRSYMWLRVCRRRDQFDGVDTFSETDGDLQTHRCTERGTLTHTHTTNTDVFTNVKALSSFLTHR